jgi:hypothetical protein
MARVIWSDGSKSMAHNLDDQYERWRMRREEMSIEDQERDISRYSELYVQTVDVTKLSTVDDCETLKTAILKSYSYLNSKITEYKRLLAPGTGPEKQHVAHIQIAALRHLQFKIGLEVRKVNNRRANINRQSDSDRDNSQSLYIRFLRASIANVAIVAGEGEINDMLQKVLDCKYEPGDRALFRAEAGYEDDDNES